MCRDRTEAKETEDYSSEGELSLPTNVSVKGANERKGDSLYWAVIAPDMRKEWTEPQKASALRITIEDLAACCALVLTEINDEDPSIPDHFEQSGVTKTEGELAVV